MRTLLGILFFSGAALAAVHGLAAQPPAGSHVSADENLCAACHTDPDLWDKDTLRFYVSKDLLGQDVHWQKGVNCHDCHGGDYTTTDFADAHSQEKGFRPVAILRKYLTSLCKTCHKEQVVELLKGVHDKAEKKDASTPGTPLSCDKCHGTIAHHLLPASDSRSPVYVENQVRTCGGCHKVEQGTYDQSVHGHGLYRSGLLVSAVCANCHGAHGIYRPADRRSTLYIANVSKTCGRCHRFIAERLEKSVHGRGGIGRMAARAAPGGKEKQTPSCTSCHQGHQIINPESERFRTQLPNLCGNCHANLSSTYRMSMHGELTELEYRPAAECADCHGSHDILAISNPKSTMAPANRLATCRKCHPYAVANMVSFDPHADPGNAAKYPLIHTIYVVLLGILVATFGAFGIHSVLWFIRSLVEVLSRGRPRQLIAGGAAVIRFDSFHRTAHTVLLICFLGLALTGLPLKYSEYDWAKGLAYLMGGFQYTGFWHRVFGLGTFGCFLAYLAKLPRAYMANRKKGLSAAGAIFGPDSPLPNLRDLKDFFKMLRWFLGLGPKPTFERWTYWEKFDFFGACSDTILIGTTGLILWFPNFFCLFLPGSAVNVAKVIHSTLALLATGFVFAIHFFNTHLRAEKFPADMSVLTGLVSEEELYHERPEYAQRLLREERLASLHASAPSRGRLWAIKLGGFAALAIGLALLAGMVLAALGG